MWSEWVSGVLRAAASKPPWCLFYGWYLKLSRKDRRAEPLSGEYLKDQHQEFAYRMGRENGLMRTNLALEALLADEIPEQQDPRPVALAAATDGAEELAPSEGGSTNGETAFGGGASGGAGATASWSDSGTPDARVCGPE